MRRRPVPSVDVAVVQKQAERRSRADRHRWIQPLGVEGGSAADHAVHLVAFGQQELGQERAVLSGDSRNKRALQVSLQVSAPFKFSCLYAEPETSNEFNPAHRQRHHAQQQQPWLQRWMLVSP